MTLQSSGTITIAQIASEFGNSADYRLSEFYRGGAEVPNIPANYGVPTSGQISFAQFYGATNYVPMSLSKSGDASGSCVSSSTGCTASTNNVTVSVSNGVAPYTYSWSFVSGSGASGTANTSATNSWTRNAGNRCGGDGGYCSYTGTYRCTVTDATSATAYIDVSVYTEHYYESGM